MGIGPKENVQLGNDTGIGPSAASNQRIGDRTKSLEVDRARECIWHSSAVDASKSRGTSLGGDEIAMRRSDSRPRTGIVSIQLLMVFANANKPWEDGTSDLGGRAG